MFRLIERPAYRGSGKHQHGWPWICSYLQSKSDPSGVLLDDFVEDSIENDPEFAARAEPWVGIFHHPPAPVDQLRNKTHADRYLADPQWKPALSHMIAAISLSEEFGTFLYHHPAITSPVITLVHPTKLTEHRFDPSALHQPTVQLLTFGSYMKNTRVLEHVATPDWIERVKVEPSEGYEANWHAACGRWLSNRQSYSGVKSLPRLSDVEFEQQLTRSVVILEFFSLAASNALLECVARNVPVLVNRLPAAVEYLGPHYPLFYSRLSEVPELLTRERLSAGYDYLVRLDKQSFSLYHFAAQLSHVCQNFYHASQNKD